MHCNILSKEEFFSEFMQIFYLAVQATYVLMSQKRIVLQNIVLIQITLSIRQKILLLPGGHTRRWLHIAWFHFMIKAL